MLGNRFETTVVSVLIGLWDMALSLGNFLGRNTENLDCLL